MTHLSAQPAPVTIDCHACGEPYEVAGANVCNCINQHRTLACPVCGACTCHQRSIDTRIFPRVREASQSQFRPEPVAQTVTRPLVLVADDDFVVRFLTRRLLERLGYAVITAADGEEAWHAIVTHRPAVVIADALMPKLDGRDLSRRIKTTDDTKSIRVAVMTALYKSAAQKSEALNDFLADAFMAKPIRPEVFEETVEELAS